MTPTQLPLGAIAIFALCLRCHAVGLEGAPGGTPTAPPTDPLPIGCEFMYQVIPGGTPPSHPIVSQILAAPYSSAVAEQPIKDWRKVRFTYNFSGLQNILPPGSFGGSFHIQSTQVTVFEGPSTDYPKASNITYTDHAGYVSLAKNVVERQATHKMKKPFPNKQESMDKGYFQNQWAIQLTSRGTLIDPAAPPRPTVVQILCAMPVTTSPVPTLTQ